jgi:hypothetical protein
MALERRFDLDGGHVCSLRIAQTSVYCDLSEFRLTIYAKIAKSKAMFMTERQSPPAAALPPTAAEPAAGIASSPRETPAMPVVSFPQLVTAAPIPAGIRQWAIEPKQCRWILADEDRGAEALMCGATVVAHRSFCAEHCTLVYMPRVSEEEAGQAEEATAEEHEPKQKEAE